MILLDTNVVSAAMEPVPGGPVFDWLDSQVAEKLYLPSITVAEIQLGLELLPWGKGRRGYEETFERFVAGGFGFRILDFDRAAAVQYGKIMARRRRMGRPMSVPDGQIAGIAKCHRMAVATSNVRDFEGCGVEVIDPRR